MNIFFLDYNPVTAAKYLCDKHVVKMALETAQMLSTVNGGPYKATHANHPCTIWIRSGMDNYEWVVRHGIAICQEYTYRFEKEHKCEDIIKSLEKPLVVIPSFGTPAPKAMPPQYHQFDLVDSYRAYYKSKQSQFEMRYTKRFRPSWL